MSNRKAKAKLANSNVVIVKQDQPKANVPLERKWPKFLALVLSVAFVVFAYFMTPNSQKLPPKPTQSAFSPRNSDFKSKG